MMNPLRLQLTLLFLLPVALLLGMSSSTLGAPKKADEFPLPSLTSLGVWEGLATNINNLVRSIAVAPNGDIYIGGTFTQVEGMTANRIAVFDGTSWSTLGGGFDGQVNVLKFAPNGDLYAGGSFNNVDGMAIQKIAKWDGSAWSDVGGGTTFSTSEAIFTLDIASDGTVYAGGFLFSQGTIAAFDGTSWGPVGLGFTNNGNFAFCLDIKVDASGNVIAAGEFDIAGGTPANNIAKWDGSTWSALGNGLDDRVNGIDFGTGNTIYATGIFKNTGSTLAEGVAEWDGTSWSPMGVGLGAGGFNFGYDILSASDGHVYVVGQFANTNSVRNVGKWDGSTWSNVAPGLNSFVQTVAEDANNKILVGGAFTGDSDFPSNSFSRIARLGEGAVCDLSITSVDATDETCPGEGDGTITATASCGSCAGGNADIRYSIDNSDFSNTTGVFTGLADGSYTVYIQDVNDDSCADSDGTYTINAGVDNTPPVFTCQNHTASLDGMGNATITPADVYDSGSDNCGTVNQVSVFPNSFTCADLGPNIVTLTVNDGNGNTSTCTAIVTVVDNTPPVITCQDHTVSLDGIGNATITPADVYDSGSDNCGTVNQVSVFPNSFTCADLGPNIVTLTVNDGNGNTSTCTATVTVEDNIFPTLQCINQTIAVNGDQNINLDADDLVDAMDNCGVQSILLSPPIISSSQVGQTVPVSVSVTDVGGNTSECISQVTVNGLPFGWSQNTDGIGCNDGNDIDYNAATQVWTATSTNCYYGFPFSSDATAFAQHTLCGNGSITARVTGISGSALGWAGVMMRESNAPGAKKAQLTTNLSNFHRREFRRVTNGAAYPQQFPGMNRYWLRIKRSGNQFRMEVSPNGTNWFFVGAQNIVMPSCIEVGLVVTNYNSNSTVTATFANVSIEGGASMQALGQMNYTNIDRENKIDAHKGFILYPNPANSEVWLNLGNYHSQDIRIELLDMQGRTIHVEEVRGATTDNHALKLMNYPSGIYLVKVTGEDRVPVVERLVIGRN